MQRALIPRTLGGIIKVTWVGVLWSCREALDQSREHIPLAVTPEEGEGILMPVYAVAL